MLGVEAVIVGANVKELMRLSVVMDLERDRLVRPGDLRLLASVLTDRVI
jgi:hypothetical protein